MVAKHRSLHSFQSFSSDTFNSNAKNRRLILRKILFFALCFSVFVCFAGDSLCFAKDIDVFKLAEKRNSYAA